MAKDMTSGNPLKLIVSFAIPLLIGNIFQQFYNMVDTIIVGRFVGVKALASVGSAGALNFLILGCVIGLTGGFAILIAQNYGAKNYDQMRHCVAMSFCLSGIVVLLITIGGQLVLPTMLRAMNTPDDIYQGAYQYISIICWGTIATMLYNLLASILRAIGDSKTPLYFLIISSLLNIVLDLWFVISFQMGVSGVAYATVISQGISGILCLIYMLKKYPILRLKKEDWRRDFGTIWKLLRLGIPMALQFSITAIGAAVLQSATNTFGSIYVASFTAANKVEQLTVQPFVTIGATLATYSGQNLGAGKVDRIKTGVRYCIIISAVLSVILGISVYFGGHQIVNLFISGNQPEVMGPARQYLNIMSACYIFLAAIFVYRNALQGIGDALVPMLGGLCELIMRSVAALYLAKTIGFLGICWAGPLAWIATGILLTIAFIARIRTLDKTTKTVVS